MNDVLSSRLERLLGRVLQIGASASTVLLTAGLLFTLASPGHDAARVLTTAGLVILMATPVARVLASVAGYAAERDWVFFGLTLSVLFVLLSSLLFAWLG